MCPRATPRAAAGGSPAQLLTGRRIRTTLPVLEEKPQPAPVDRRRVQERDAQTKSSRRIYHGRRHSACPLPPLHQGQDVRVQTGERRAGGPRVQRSYPVATDSGAVPRPHRRHPQALPQSAHRSDRQEPRPERPTPPPSGPSPAASPAPQRPATRPEGPWPSPGALTPAYTAARRGTGDLQGP